MQNEHEEDFQEWWGLVGNKIIRSAGESEEDFAKRVALRSWAGCVDVNNLGD